MYYIYEYMRKQYEEYSGNKLDGKPGTPVDDLMIKPTGLTMQKFYDFLVQEKRINSIDLWEEWTEEEMDYFASKYFYFRQQGDTVSVTVRVYFDYVQEFKMDQTVSFITENNLQYLPVDEETITTSSYKNSDIPTANYYIDFLCAASAPGDQYQIEANKITGVDGATFVWKSITNPYRSLGGSTHEINDEFYERIKYSLNERSLNNERGLIANLRSKFPSVNSVYISGAGDVYMNRDLVSGVTQAEEEKIKDFRGKFVDSNQVKSLAFKGIFPPPPGSEVADTYWGPHSVRSEYKRPFTIDSVASGPIDPYSLDPTLSDPAWFGFPPEEVNNEQYKGMYFNDIVNHCEYGTEPLFDLKSLNLPYSFSPTITAENAKVVPDENWVYGEEGGRNGVVTNLGANIGIQDVLLFNYNNIAMGASGKTISAGLKINKFTGTKYTGSFVWPTGGDSENIKDGINSTLQFILGGKDDTNRIDTYSGIGFGIKTFDEWDSEAYDRPNCVVFFNMNSKYGDHTVYAQANATNYVDTTTLNSIKEAAWRLEPGSKYFFEFVINDNLRLTLLIRKEERLNDLNPDENEFRMELPKNFLEMFANTEGGIFQWKITPDMPPPRFGSTMKIALETPSIGADQANSEGLEKWNIQDLKVFDTNALRAQMLIAMDVDRLDAPFVISLGANATGNAQGYIAYIWDKGSISIASGEEELTSGAWTELGELSNSDGTKKPINGLLTETVYNYDRYVTDSRYGKKVWILLVPSGSSAPAILFDGNEGSDVLSEISVDYIKIESSTSLQFHSNTKADIYVNTWKNETEIQPETTEIEKQTGEEYFELSRENGFIIPIADIVEVSVTSSFAGRQLSANEYELIYPVESHRNSGKEVVRLYAYDQTIDSVSIRYIPYPDIIRMQDVFEDSRLKSNFGDFLAIHKFPVVLNISFNIAIDINVRDMQDLTRRYLDSITNVFSIEGFRQYFLDSDYNITDINVEYEYVTESGIPTSGTIVDSYKVREIDFFKSGVITING